MYAAERRTRPFPVHVRLAELRSGPLSCWVSKASLSSMLLSPVHWAIRLGPIADRVLPLGLICHVRALIMCTGCCPFLTETQGMGCRAACSLVSLFILIVTNFSKPLQSARGCERRMIHGGLGSGGSNGIGSTSVRFSEETVGRRRGKVNWMSGGLGMRD